MSKLFFYVSVLFMTCAMSILRKVVWYRGRCVQNSKIKVKSEELTLLCKRRKVMVEERKRVLIRKEKEEAACRGEAAAAAHAWRLINALC